MCIEDKIKKIIEDEYKDLSPKLENIKKDMEDLMIKTFNSLKDKQKDLGYEHLSDDELLDETIKRISKSSSKVMKHVNAIIGEIGDYLTPKTDDMKDVR